MTFMKIDRLTLDSIRLFNVILNIFDIFNLKLTTNFNSMPTFLTIQYQYITRLSVILSLEISTVK